MNNTNKLVFIDSNIWLYCFLSGQYQDPEEDARKRIVANSITDVEGIVISSQVINEVCSILKRKVGFNEEEIFNLIESFESRYQIVSVDLLVVKNASRLRQQYSFSFWDSLIIASALEARITTLYSKDMQDGLLIPGTLEIMNPFKEN
ncbi:MAG: PIN domain-containing protein [Okeania sp. SIO3I5]|uniref:PIN domain-containing protein n=1 Tax=Okeania sp. SIO3I5 TaxID=2607805 RepID=UPI0013BACDD7|nr:PIN domain-containing protein [Okeania sp. SIO3I5]NEQ37149.1 PIN domain-containing protein [Okeania sp. SIO3I5]